MTNKWHSVTLSWQTFAPPLHIWPPLLSQTTLVKRDDRDGKTHPSSGSKKLVFPFIIQTFVALVDTDFSWLFPALAVEGTGECQRFSTFGLIFICHISSPCELGRKEKSIFLTYSEVGAPPLAGILPSQPLSMYISISALDIQSFCLDDSAQIRPALILLFAYSNVTFLCYSNFQFVIFKYLKLNLIIGDFSEADIGFSHLPFTFEQIFQEKTFWMDSLINFLTKEIFRNSKYFPAPSENVSKCVFLMNGQT